MSKSSKKIQRRNNLSVFFYLEELTSRIVAQTGIPSDRFHLGKIIFQGLKDNLDLVSQIDGALNASETNRSVLERSVSCANGFRKLGLQCGDVMIIMASNHIDVAIPIYAALNLGIAIAGIDMTLGVQELQSVFDIHQPNIVFCHANKTSDVETVLKNNNGSTHVITFDTGSKFRCFSDFLEENSIDSCVEDFTSNDFDPAETVAFLNSTSGSTGLPKAAMLTHKNLMISAPHYMARFYDFPNPTRLYFFISPLQWLTAVVQYISSPMLQYTRLQTSGPSTKEHFYDLINKYKPTSTIMSPTMLTTLLTEGDRDKCDFSCFEAILTSGSYISENLVNSLKKVAPQASYDLLYGLTEVGGEALAYDDEAPSNSIGKPIGHLRHRLIDPSTLKDIDEPNIPGELWLKGPSVFKGYYNNPEMTKEAFSDDGWFKSGDLIMRDESYNYYFVDRLKSLLKYRNHQISPIEVEEVIRKHPGVQDVVVVGIPDEECGDLPAACVVTRAERSVTAREIKDLVKENLTDTKHLRGGVVFMKELPMTATGKINRPKLKQMIPEMKWE